MKRLVSLSFGLAMTLLASQAFAFGVSVAPPHVGSIGVGNIRGVGPGVNVNGAVTVRGITVLPNGTMIVPAVTPHSRTVVTPPTTIEGPLKLDAAPRSGNIGGKNVQPPYGNACYHESYYGICF